jgi:hypothetical protein
MIINAKLDVTKILKDILFKGKVKADGSQPIYLDICLLSNRDGKDQYDNDGMVVQSLPRERREAGEKGPILGNFRISVPDAPKAPAQSEHNNSKSNGYAPQLKDDDDKLPF